MEHQFHSEPNFGRISRTVFSFSIFLCPTLITADSFWVAFEFHDNCIDLFNYRHGGTDAMGIKTRRR